MHRAGALAARRAWWFASIERSGREEHGRIGVSAAADLSWADDGRAASLPHSIVLAP
jgi:hypothetical protein